MAALRALVADDEPLARARLLRLLGQFDDVEVVAECANGGDAVAQIQSRQPELVFLDIQMPDFDGFDVLGCLPRERQPHVVFVTAYSEHAVRAFEARALDYLLKPVSAERLREAVDRARMARTPAVTAAGPGYAQRIPVPVGLRIHLVPVEDIDYITAHANYVELHLGARSLVLRQTMANLEARLDPRRFLRIHRSRIVRLDAVLDAEPLAPAQLVLRLKTGVRLASGRSYYARTRSALGLTGSA